MIQRIQSVWLLLAAVCAGLTFFVPFGTEFVSALDTRQVNADGMNAHTNPVVLIITLCMIASALLNIFVYKKRKIQKYVTAVLILQGLLCVAYMVYATEFQHENTSIRFGIVAPVLSIIFASLAYKGISNDDKLVKNLDRLR